MDWSGDVLEIDRTPGLHRFGIVGISGGGPYAAVCAHQIPDRLSSAALVGSVALLQVPGITHRMGVGRYFFRLARLAPSLAGMMMNSMKSAAQDPAHFIAQTCAGMAPPDEVFLSQPETMSALINTMMEAIRQGGDAVGYDAALIARPWGFRLEGIRMPVHIWHGELDSNAPIAMGRYLAASIPSSRERFFPQEGHISLIRSFEELIEAMQS